jgi:D-serine deaminase-like pyridoxal phosphate-dependent protein
MRFGRAKEVPLPQDSIPALSSPASAITALNKGLRWFDGTRTVEEIRREGWNLLREDISLPAAVLEEEKLEHNLDWMQRFVAAYGARLAPHGKTTMSPHLFARQLRHGAWGITVATAQQAMVAFQHGVPRVLMANQLIGRENMRAISKMIESSRFDFYCLVDSADQIDQLGAFFAEQRQRLQVLLELGVMGGRCGIRDEEQLQAALAALARWQQSILLRGVEIYEGLLDDESAIRALLQRAVRVTRDLIRDSRFPAAPVLISGAGSAWYDVVAEEFSSSSLKSQVEIVLRPGCYISHDVGAYSKAQSRILESNPIARRLDSGLVPALKIWAYVQSRPEPEKAIIAMGKRDVAFDAGLPVPTLRFRPGETHPQPCPQHWQITRIMDQHAFLEIHAGDDLRVGDMLAFDISHPCLTFDKWRTILIVNARYDITDVAETWF